MTFTALIREARHEAGLSQAEAARACPGLSVRTIQNWESGRNIPHQLTLAAYLRALQDASRARRRGSTG